MRRLEVKQGGAARTAKSAKNANIANQESRKDPSRGSGQSPDH